MDKVPMTHEGAEALRTELDKLKTIERPRIVNAIAEARAHGDLKENAEYHSAREQQAFTEGRIKEIESKLSHAHIIDVSKIPHTGKVVFGVTVRLEHVETGEQVTYKLVGEDEADLKHGKVSIGSPIARALIGKSEGDGVEVNAPGGVIEYDIVEVQYV